jgi:hypothetical protein
MCAPGAGFRGVALCGFSKNDKASFLWLLSGRDDGAKQTTAGATAIFSRCGFAFAPAFGRAEAALRLRLIAQAKAWAYPRSKSRNKNEAGSLRSSGRCAAFGRDDGFWVG